MKKISIFAFLTCFLASFQMLKAQDEQGGNFSVDVQIRPRLEYRNGYSYPREKDDNASAFISNRARLGLNFNNGFFSTRVAGQEVSVWGSKKLTDNAGNFTINEAWGQISKNGFFAKLGRQALHYDDGIIISTAEWNQAGKWHDALKAGYENQHNKFHLILAYNQASEKTNSGTFYKGDYPYKNMQTVWYHYDSDNGFGASVLFMNLGLEAGTAGTGGTPDASKTVYLQTMGTHLTYRTEPFSILGAFYYQTGKNQRQKEVSAHLAQLKGGYSFSPKFSLSLGLDHLSGQDPTSDKVTQIDLMNAGMHKFFGYMDYFSNDRYYGLFDKYATLTWKPMQKLSLELSYLHFSSTQLINVNGTEKKNLGSEVDFVLTYPLRKYITLQAGYSVMFPTEAMTVYKGGDHTIWQDWGFITVNINPTLFKTKF
jgi:hypothetical protein